VYRQRRPEESVLYDVVRRNLETYIALREAEPDAEPLPRYVEKTFREFMRCGLPQWGVALVECSSDSCRSAYAIPFSCARRGGICASCAARHQARAAAHLVDHVLPRVPIRHWTISFPKRVRFFLERHHEAASGVLRVCLRAIESRLRERSPGAPRDSRFGAVVTSHRTGSTLQRNFHFHSPITDGVFAKDEDRPDEARFFEATELTDEDVADLEETIRRRVLRYLVRHGQLDRAAADDMLTWEHSGFSLDATTRIEAWDRFALERLARYCTRPPLSPARLDRVDDDTLIYRLARPAHDGTTSVILTPLELIDRLARSVPPPRKNVLKYFGVFGPAARLRQAVTASAGPAAAMQLQLEEAARRMGLEDQEGASGPAPADDHENTESSQEPRRRLSTYLWAMLIARLFDALPLVCPRCGAVMRVKSFVVNSGEVRRLLEHLGEPPEALPLEPARGPPQGDFDLDQTAGLPEDQVWS